MKNVILNILLSFTEFWPWNFSQYFNSIRSYSNFKNNEIFDQNVEDISNTYLEKNKYVKYYNMYHNLLNKIYLNYFSIFIFWIDNL